ncbi:MAG: oligopeptidase A, partial [Nitrosomonadales bacterium]|nr:oligopeptidase A [Nitrosomonadales bacterium]
MSTNHTDLSNNPLLDFSGLPKFDQVQAKHVTPAIEHLMAEGRVLLESLASSKETPNWDNFVRPLEDMEEQISRAWSQVGHMNAVVNSPELREAYNDSLPKLTDFYSDLSQDERLYAKYRALRASDEYERLNTAQRKIVENELRDFRLGGAELPSDKKARFKEIQEALSKLAAKFEENLLDTTNDFAHYVESADALKGIPEDTLQA